MTIDIGAGYSRLQTDYEWTTINGRTRPISGRSLPWRQFCQRWYPLKLNVGIMADFNILSYTIDYYSRTYSDEPFYHDTT